MRLHIVGRQALELSLALERDVPRVVADVAGVILAELRERLATARLGGPERARSGGRRVFFDDRFVDTPLHDRTRLQPGDAVEGPAIVEEFGSTTVVFPAQQVRVDDYGNLVLTRLE